jgi:hypothetical protein
MIEEDLNEGSKGNEEGSGLGFLDGPRSFDEFALACVTFEGLGF